MKTVLVTGGAGYIGSHVVLALRESGRRIVVVDDLSTGNPAALPADVELVVADIGDTTRLGEIMQLSQADATMHFAGSVIVSESVEKPLDYYANNTANTLSVLRACQTAGVSRLVFSSTAAIYGPPQSLPVAEDAPAAPMSPYGASKFMAERMISDAATANGLSYATLRYFNVAGADPQARIGQMAANAGHLIKRVCDVILGRLPHLDIYGSDYDTPDGTCIRDFIHVSDLADAHVAALDHLFLNSGGSVFNCGYGRGYSVLDVVKAAEAVSGRTVPVQHAARRAGDIPQMVACNDRIRSILGWTPKYDDLQAMIRHTLAWENRSIPPRLG